MPDTKIDSAGGAMAGEPAKPIPGVTQDPPPADMSDPNRTPAGTGVDAKVEAEPVEMPKSEFEGGTNVASIPAGPAKPAAKK